MNRLTLGMAPDNLYPLIEWVDENGVRVSAIVTHEFSNIVDGVQYRHAHMSVYVTDSSGVTKGRLDIPYGHDHTQIQIEHADLVMKGAGCSVVLRSSGGKFHRLEVDDAGNLSTSPVPSSEIIKASVPV